MSSSSEDDRRNLYSQERAGPSKMRNDFDATSSGEEDDGYGIREEDTIDVDDAITMLLASLNLEGSRKRIPTEIDDENLRKLHEKIFCVIAREPDDVRRRRLKKTLPESNCVREQIYYLRRHPSSPAQAYFNRLSTALDTIVKESFDEDYRKVATILGLVECLAEVLVMEVMVFKIPQIHQNEHRTIRKLIANALTNLTYGQIHSKRRLCSYSDFVRAVVKIVVEAPNLTQVYAGLIRNLSWMADDEMSCALRPTVRALAIASVDAHQRNDDGCVRATLSALWNLASHSVENKKSICESPNCLALLCALLTPDARMTAVVDSVTGILKYVSQYLANTSTHLELRSVLVSRLVHLLGSASFTIVTNTLGAIASLIAKDPHLQNMIRHDPNASQQLNVLRNSTREDVRSAVKHVLNAINQPSGHTRFGEMTCSLGSTATGHSMPSTMVTSMNDQMMSGGAPGPSGASALVYHQQQMVLSSTNAVHSPRLLPLRAARASPGRFGLAPPVVQDTRSYSLPRQFVGRNQEMNFGQLPPLPPSQPPPQPPTEPEMDAFLTSESAMGTRANSVRSLGSQDPGSVLQDNTSTGWNSTLDTAANSSRMSPVSLADLPPSPTMCAAIYAAQAAQGQTAPTLTSDVPNFIFPTSAPFQNPTTSTTPASGATQSSGSATTVRKNLENSFCNMQRPGSSGSQRAGVAVSEIPKLTEDDMITPTYPQAQLHSPDDILPGPSLMEHADYAMLELDSNLLKQSIQSEMPRTPVKGQKSRQMGGFFAQGQRSPKPGKISDADRLLMECIESEMPKMSLTLAKNEQGDRREDESSDRQQISDGMDSPQEKPRNNGLSRQESLESRASSEDSFGLTPSNENNELKTEWYTKKESDLDCSIPLDCFDDTDEEDVSAANDSVITIDCSIISKGSSLSSSGNGSSRTTLTSSSRGRGALATSTPKNSTTGLRNPTRVSRLPQPSVALRKPIEKISTTLKQQKMEVVSRPRLPPKPKQMILSPNFDNSHHQTMSETIYVNTMEDDDKQPKSAIISPYNYQKPLMTKSNGEIQQKKEKTVLNNSNAKMIVTTV